MKRTRKKTTKESSEDTIARALETALLHRGAKPNRSRRDDDEREENDDDQREKRDDLLGQVEDDDPQDEIDELTARFEDDDPIDELQESLDSGGLLENIEGPNDLGPFGVTPGDGSRSDMLPTIDDGPRTPGKPLWMFEGQDLEKMPVELRQAAEEIVKPAYEQLVVRASNPMDRSVGVSITHLLWLEILDQYDLKRNYRSRMRTAEFGPNRRRVDHHIRLLDSKLRHELFMLRLEESRRAASGRQLPPQSPSSVNFVQITPKAEPSAFPSLDALYYKAAQMGRELEEAKK